MHYNKIRKMDISNGPGVRVSIFLQGCSFNCKNCFNPETHDFNKGEEFTYDTINKLLELSDKKYINGLSILGGEPLHEFNILGTIKLAKAFKEKFPDKTVWVWTGFLFENVINKDIFKYIDVLVDGRFEEEHKDIRLKYCGSTNQRVIDIQQSLKKNKVILYEKR